MSDSSGKNRYSVFGSARLEVFRTDAVFHRVNPHPAPKTIAKRGKVSSLTPSADSLKRLVFVLNNCDRQMRSMMTVTFHDEVGISIPVVSHRKLLSKLIRRFRHLHPEGEYVWVREFQSCRLIEGMSDEQAPVHWHIFTTERVDAGNEKTDCVDRVRSADWSKFLVGQVHRLTRNEPEYQPANVNKMLQSKYHVGCVNWQNLYGPAGGRYAAKEGAKRYQKMAPTKWQNDGGNWWDKSRTIKCSPVAWRYVRHSDLKTVKRKLPDGTEINVTLKHQWGHGGFRSGDTCHDQQQRRAKRNRDDRRKRKRVPVRSSPEIDFVVDRETRRQ